MLAEHISFKNSLNLNIHGRLYLPDQVVEQLPLVIFSHGLNSGRASSTIQAISQQLMTRQIAALLFDFTGHGESEGSIAEATISQQEDDLTCAIAFARADKRFGLLGIYGEITGGTVALRVAAADNDIKALVLQGPREDEDADENIVNQIQTPTLIVQGSSDLVVRAESKLIYNNLDSKKRLHIIAGAGHLVDEHPDYLKQATEVTLDWFSKYLTRARTAGV